MLKGLSAINRFCEVILKYSIYSLVFLLPILFLPWTSDALDFNKQTLLVLLVFVALFSWLAKVLISGRFSINLNKTHIAVLVLFLVFLVSTIFSQDRYGSFWGLPRVTSESLLTVISLALLYFLVSNVFTKKEIHTSIILLALSSLLAVFAGVLQLFGLYLPLGFIKSTSFNTIGLVGIFGLFVAVLLPLLIILEIYSKKWLKIVFAIGIVLSIISLVLINYSMVWWVVLIGCALLMLFSMLQKDLFDLRWLGLPIFFLVVALFFLILNPQLPVPARAVEIYLNQSATFDVALKTLKDRPILGSGPGTFIFDFSKYKKVDFNQGALWNIRFDTGGSKILTVLATTGILGFVSFLALIATALLYGVKFILNKGPIYGREGDNGYSLALSGGILVGFVSLTISYFLYSSNLSLDFLFFFLMACFIGLTGQNKKEFLLNPASFLTLGVTFVFTLFFIFGLGLLILDGQRYLAEVNYSRGISLFVSGQKDQGSEKIESAVRLNPNADIYLAQLAQVYLSKLGDVIDDQKMSQEDKNKTVQLLINNSINAAKISTDASPKNVSNWSIRGYIYQSLIGLVPGSEDWALKSYDEAINLEPFNPYYPTQQGVAYMAKAATVDKDSAGKKSQDLDNAKKQFDKAVQLKSDYASARFQTAMVYQAQGKTDQEVAALEDAKKYSPNDVGLLFQIGVVYYQEGNYDKAKQNLEAAVNISPNYANALYFLGLAYSKLGQVDKAIAQFQKVSNLNPNSTDVNKIIENLKAGRKPLDGIVQENPPQAPVEETPPESPKK
jgi:tetratricopeptide (TPR) repeat protein